MASRKCARRPSSPEVDTYPHPLVTVKQFIRNVRSAKTIADERAVIQKESAAIRASFREESHDSNIRSATPQPNGPHIEV